MSAGGAELLARLTDALHIELSTVERLIEQERTEHLAAWEQWASQPVPISLVAKIMPAIYVDVPLPHDVTTEVDAISFATAYAKQHSRQVWLALSRRVTVWINKQGEVEGRTQATPDGANVPFMRLRGSSKTFLFRFGKGGQRQD
jgi:hypothetical protein